MDNERSEALTRNRFKAPTVKTFNTTDLKKIIAKADPVLTDYIKAQKKVIAMMDETNDMAIKKIKFQAGIIAALEAGLRDLEIKSEYHTKE